MDDLIAQYANIAGFIYDGRLAGDHTWEGVFAAFAREAQNLNESK